MIKKFNVEKTKQIKKIDKVVSFFCKRPKKIHTKLLVDVENILIVDFSLIGDMVMNIPFLRNIRENCPKAKITMVCLPWAKSVLGSQGYIDEFIFFNGKDILSSPKKIIKNIKEIRKILKKINVKRYDIGIEPKGDLRHILFMHYTKCDRTITYNYTGGEKLVTDCYVPLDSVKHLVDEKLQLLKFAGFNIYDEFNVPKLNLDESALQIIDDFVKENQIQLGNIIGIHPGASNINKQYPNYPQLMKKIIECSKNDYTFIVFEGPQDKNIVDQVCHSLSKKRFLRVKKTLEEYIALVSICDYMICNDSAASHIAAAYGKNVLIAYGPTEVQTAKPYSDGKVIALSKDLECKPCTLPVCHKGTNECICQIGVEEMYVAAVELGII